MKKIYLLASLFLTSMLFGQTEVTVVGEAPRQVSQEEIAEKEMLFSGKKVLTESGSSIAQPGTYQYVYKSREMESDQLLTESQLAFLEKNRHAVSTKYFRLNEKTIIKLLPKQEITNSTFVPLVSKIFIIEEADFYNYQGLRTIQLP